MKKKSIIQVNGKNIELGQTTWIMGILNVTPDSFSDGGLYFNRNRAINRGLEMISEGADIIDVGGESTRPGSDPISAKEERLRVIPVISGLREQTDTLISVDTTKSEVAEAALDAGVDIINDISSFRFDSRMVTLAAQREVPVILMHMKGIPKTMQVNPYYEDLLSEIKSFFAERIDTAVSHGIKRGKIIIDPGIGFGKKHTDNLILIKNIHFLQCFDRPILIGVSRKAFIGEILGLPSSRERTEGTIAASLLSIANGAHILRVHEVASVKRAVRVAEAILNEDSYPCAYGDNKEKKGTYVH